ncbi:MAG: hypothetical protein MZV64_27840 [Ignavibacteriales bacterium]|nr:hypothetical protein [Ignavibacteriales bacterium]
MYLANADSFIPSRLGVALGFEQTVIPNKFTIAVDWMSRNEPYAFLAPRHKI